MSEEQNIFHEHLKRTGNRITSQRDLILKAILDTGGHLTAEDVYQRAKAEDPMLGFTTVYRTLKLLADCGLVREERFGDGHTRYEYSYNRQHHDHLICTECGLVIEFYNEFIENEQERITEEFKFQATHHSLRIFGLCEKCRNADVRRSVLHR